ncbi:hypothetical protein D9758_018763 [Tetrapyrgos nigripes]|uniref:Uncharacterized protein n=1 Tax=Tetrapyrgos nigripes TaxID=182062 RepID=A0A8H5F1Y8_9AGAR|nr:hypothetical protein D9758_018763 [Tetrapyrgos nigripes]
MSSTASVSELRLDLKLYLSQSMLESLLPRYFLHGYVHHDPTQRGAGVVARWDFWALVLLFVIATVVTVTDLIANASILYNTFGLGGLHPGLSKLQIHRFNISMQMLAEMGYVFANILADCILIRRCYVVWNSNWKIVILPIFLSIVNNAVGFSAVVMLIDVFLGSLSLEKATQLLNAANKMLEAFFGVNIVSNVLLTFLIAGRIWWIMKQLERMDPDAKGLDDTRRRYRTVIALIVESGLLYPVSVIVFEIILHVVTLSPSLYPLMTTLAGMAPTLIIVRVHLGVSVNTLGEGVNSLNLTAHKGGLRRSGSSVSDGNSIKKRDEEHAV